MNNKILHIPSLDMFNDDIELLFSFLERRGYPKWSFGGNLSLIGDKIESLKNLTSIHGYLDLMYNPIKTLEALTYVGGWLDLKGASVESLGNLTSVGGFLDLRETQITSLGNLTYVDGFLDVRFCKNLTSLGNLSSVESHFYIQNTPLYDKYSEKEIRKMVNIKGDIYYVV